MANDSTRQDVIVSGKPATVCPYCGCGLFVDGVNRTDHDIVRYIQCRNKKCGKRFVSRQAPAKIVREIEDNSAGGNSDLTLYRESA